MNQGRSLFIIVFLLYPVNGCVDGTIDEDFLATTIEDPGEGDEDSLPADTKPEAEENPALKLCQNKPGAPGAHTLEVMVGKVKRNAYVFIPEWLDPNEPAPLLFVFHGFGGNGQGQAKASRLKKLANEEGFIVVAPNGKKAWGGMLGQSWNMGPNPICGVAGFVSNTRVDDFGMMEKLYEEVAAYHCIDTDRVFATGFSQGSGFTHNVGCSGPDFIRAIAPFAQGTGYRNICEQPPKPVLILIGTNDFVTYYCQRKARDLWIERNGCASAVEREVPIKGGKCYHYDCPAEAPVVFCEFKGMGHTWGGQGYEVPEYLIWDFFMQQ